MAALERMIGGLAALKRLAARLGGDRRGNVAMIFALAMPALVMITLCGVDLHRITTVKARLQDALDAAALAAARSSYSDEAGLKQVAYVALKANLQDSGVEPVSADALEISLQDDQVIVADARVDVQTLVANIFLPPYGRLLDDTLPVSSHSEVNRSSKNIEVALVLDITGSMKGSRLSALKSAAKELVDLVVQDVQTPWYSKIALVPYSMGVNVGSYASQARGGVTGSVNITGAVINLTGAARTISAATRARPVVITSNNHGFANNDVVWISGVSGMTQLNNKAYKVANKTANTFELRTLSGGNVDGRNYNAYSANGKVQKCQDNDCSITVTASGHGLRNNDYVRITDVGGMTQINNQTYLVGNATTDTFTIDPDQSSLSPYTSGGRAWCAQAGCTWFAFENMYGDLTTQQISTCVTERTGTQAYTDAAPSTARVGRNYPGASNPCLSSTIVPLSSSKSSLKTTIDGFAAEGSTAGQIGIGWGWYMVSPNFNGLWPSGAAGPYEPGKTLKAVVIMTDGEFNTPYCSGVISRDAGSGSGSDAEKIACAADNGGPFTQGKAMCDGMKAQRIVVYTVGFQIAQGGDAADLLSYCASSPENFFLPADGGSLSDAFKAIGRDISRLRISK